MAAETEDPRALMAALAQGERAALARLIALYGPGVCRADPA